MMKIRKIAIWASAFLLAFASAACSKQSDENGFKTAESKTKAEPIEVTDIPGLLKLGNYKGLELIVSSDVVTDEEVESQLDYIRRNSTTEVTGRAAQIGDTVNIDYTGKLNGEEFEGGKATGAYLTLGSGQFIPGFEDAVVGMNIGDQKNIDLTFPQEYHSEELAGKAVVFEVKLNAIEAPVEELTDAWVKENTQGEFNTLAEYKDNLRKDLEEYAKASRKNEGYSQGLDQVIANSEFAITDEDLSTIINDIKTRNEEIAKSMGSTVEELVTSNGSTMEKFEEDIKKSAELIKKRELVVEAIVKLEKLEITQADYDNMVAEIGMSVEELEAQYGKEFVDNQVKYLKAVDFIYENAVLVDRPDLPELSVPASQ